MKLFEYILVKILHSFFKIVPLQFNQKIAQFLAYLIRNVIRYRVRVVRTNLEICFPDYSVSEINRIIKEVYFNFSCLWTELLQNERYTSTYINHHIRLHNFEVVENAQKYGKGLILLSGHIGNFEWLGYYIALRLNSLFAVMKPVRNRRINEFIIKLRSRDGIRLIFTKGALKQCLYALRDKESIALVVDQDAGHKGIFVEFFNKPASTAMGTAQLHLETGAPIIFCTGIRRKWGEFDFYFERIPEINTEKNEKQNIFNITQMHTRLLEKWVKKYPGQYFWTHKRWKTIPDKGEMEKYINNLAVYNTSDIKVH